MWSATRPSIIYIGRKDGTLEVWDLKDQLRKPTATAAISACSLTALAFPQLQQQVQQQTVSRSRSRSRKLTRNTLAQKAIEFPYAASQSLTHLAVGDALGALRILKLSFSFYTPVRKGALIARLIS